MTKPDFRFVEIGAELEALSNALRTLEEQLVFLRDQRRLQKFGDLRERGQESNRDEVDLALHELDLHDQAYSKTFRGGFIVALWAVYESALHEVAEFVRLRKGKALAPTELRGGNVIERLRKYCTHILEFELHQKETDWSFLGALYTVRNAVAHANGRLSAMNGATRKAIDRMLSQDTGIEIRSGDLIIGESFARRALQIVEVLVKDLVARARALDDRARADVNSG